MAASEMRLRLVLDALDKVSGPLKDIVGGSSRAAKAVKETTAQLRALEDQQKKIDGFHRQQSALAEQTEKLDAARAKQTALQAALTATTEPTKKLQREYDKAALAVTRLETLTEAQTGSLTRLQTEMKEAGIDTGKLAAHEARLATQVAVTSAALREQQARYDRLATAKRNFDQRTATAQKVGTAGAATLGAGVAIALPLKGAVDAASEYESVMTDIAQKSDMSRAASKKLGEQLLVIAKNTNQYADQIQDGMDTLTGKGLDANIAAKMMAPIGKAATAYKAEIGDLSKSSYAVYKNLQVPLNQVGKALDVMAEGGKAGSFELRDMAQFFPALSAGYAGMGQKGVGAVADLTAALEIATDGAGSAAEGANNVQNLINKINSKETTDNFAKFGIDLPKALKKAAAEGKTPIEAIAELTQKALGGNTEKLSYLFNDMQVQAALRPLMQHMDEFRKIRAKAFAANGTTDKDFAIRMEDAKEKTKAGEIAIKNLGITVGAQLLPTIAMLAEKIGAVATKLAAWTNRHPVLAKAIILTTAAVTGLLVVLGSIGIAAGAAMYGWSGMAFGMSKGLPLFKKMAGGFGEIVMAARKAGTFLMANPIYLAIAAIALAAYLIYRNWGTIGPWLAGVWNKITGIFTSGVMFLTQRVPAMMGQVGINIVQGIWGGITSAKAWLMGKLAELASLIPEPIRKALGIHSPSRVFAAIGGHMMTGLDQGIAGGSGGPLKRVGTLSSRLTRAVAAGATAASIAVAPAPAAAGGAGTAQGAATAAQGGAGPSYHITINAGSDKAQDIAKAVQEAIAKLHRDQAARAFKDD
ncbi:MAG: phage tail tape measure protein [Rhizomicrobium sp.]